MGSVADQIPDEWQIPDEFIVQQSPEPPPAPAVAPDDSSDGSMKLPLIAKLVWITIVLALGLFIVHWGVNKKNEREASEAREAETLRTREAEALRTRAALAQLASRYNAVDDWDKQLSKGKVFRTSPILSIELERLWQGNRPVLFIGYIKDVSSADANNYELLVERNDIGMDQKFWTVLRVSLRAPKATVDSFLKEHPELLEEDRDTYRSIALVAKVTNITTTDKRGEDGERVEMKIGHGELLELFYIGKVRTLLHEEQ